MAFRVRRVVKTFPGFLRFFSKSPLCNGKGKRPGESFQTNGAVDLLVKEELENVAAMEDFLNRETRSPRQRGRESDILLERELKCQQTILKMKIMKRKYFKEPQEVSLLTWAAKEQIRYLNQQFPDEWTPEILAEHFPVSREGVIRLLKGKYSSRSEKDIVTHDQRVLARLQKLKEELQVGEPAGGSQYQHIFSFSKLALMVNAGGAANLPKPRRTKYKDNSRTPERRQLGAFESIVAESVSQRPREEQRWHRQSVCQKDTAQKLVQDILLAGKKYETS